MGICAKCILGKYGHCGQCWGEIEKMMRERRKTFGHLMMALPSIMLLISATNSKPWKYRKMLGDHWGGHWGGVAGAGFDQPALLHDDMWSF